MRTSPGTSSLATAVATGEESNNDAAEADDGADDAGDDTADAVDDGHNTVSDGSKSRLDTRHDAAHGDGFKMWFVLGRL